MKTFITISYFHTSKEGICASDFNKKTKKKIINCSQIISVSDLQEFTLPMTGKYVGMYAEIRMIDGCVYYIDEGETKNIWDLLVGIA